MSAIKITKEYFQNEVYNSDKPVLLDFMLNGVDHAVW